jgi:hypothetical protein
MKYLLVIFIMASSGDGMNPMVMEELFSTHLACLNAGFTMKTRQPRRIVAFNCEPLHDTIGDE